MFAEEFTSVGVSGVSEQMQDGWAPVHDLGTWDTRDRRKRSRVFWGKVQMFPACDG